ncbi:MAG: FxsA family protein [Sphingomonadales bacterium]|nr:FxsA family protein [Sphingomonadales bacterium]
MPFLIVLALLALPFAEIAVFIAVGRQLGVWATLGLTVLISLIGLSLVAGQGLTNLRRLQITLNAGEPPVAELVHGVLLFVAGFCLFVPGFITDVAGMLLLLPPVRAWLGRAFLGVLLQKARRGQAGVVIIEGEARETPSAEPPPPRVIEPTEKR